MLVTILATIGGGVVVGVGGGLIKPMQHRWEDYLSRAEAEAPRVREQARRSPSAAEQAGAATVRASSSAWSTGGSSVSSTQPYGGTTP